MHKEHMNHAGASFAGKGNLSQSMTNKLKTEDVDGFSGLSTSMIVGMLLVVPVVLLLVTTLLMRMNNSGSGIHFLLKFDKCFISSPVTTLLL